MTDQQREIEERASRIIWEAAGLRPGVPGHVTKTALLVGRMRELLREAQHTAAAQVVPVQGEQPSPTGRIGTPEPPKLQQLHAPGVDQAELNRLLVAYTKPERRH